MTLVMVTVAVACTGHDEVVLVGLLVDVEGLLADGDEVVGVVAEDDAVPVRQLHALETLADPQVETFEGVG